MSVGPASDTIPCEGCGERGPGTLRAWCHNCWQLAGNIRYYRTLHGEAATRRFVEKVLAGGRDVGQGGDRS